MDAITLVGIILVITFGLAFAIVLFKDDKKSKGEKNNTGNNEAVTRQEGKVVRNNKNSVNQKDIFEFMEFDRIVDNMILQDKETKYTMIIQCKGINYDLMSEIEQMAVEEGFITFLNTLKFPVQLYVQARAVDLKKSLDIYNTSVSDIESRYNDAEDEYKRYVNEINTDFTKLKASKNKRDRMAHILDYAQDITKYVEKISLNKHVLQRKFYIALSYYKSEVVTTTEFSEQEIHDICYRELYTRAQSIVSALLSCSVTGRVLTSNELAELLYISYNRDDEKLLDIRTALESGFYRLYSTSKDVFDKKEQAMQQQVEEEARRRVKEAIYQTLSRQNVRSEEQLIEEFEERVDREAVNIINTSDASDEIKEDLTNIIAENHVIGVEQRRREKIRKEQELAENAKTKNDEEQVNEVKEENKNEVKEENELENSNIETSEDIVVNKNLEISVAQKEELLNKENERLAEESENINVVRELNNNQVNEPLFDDRLGEDDEDDIIV